MQDRKVLSTTWFYKNGATCFINNLELSSTGSKLKCDRRLVLREPETNRKSIK